MHGPACLNCGAALQGDYCAACGQPAHEGREPSVGHFLHELTHEFLHVDGKIVGTVRKLVGDPGALTREYWAGKIARRIRPLRMFLVVVAINLLFVHNGVGPMNVRVRIERNDAGDRNVYLGNTPRVRTQAGFHAAPESEAREFFSQFAKAYSAIRYTSVLAFAVGSWLLYRKNQRYLVNHLVFGLHYYSLWYLLALLGSVHEQVGPATLLVSLALLWASLDRVYGERWYLAIPKTVTLFAFMVLVETELGVAAANLVERGLVPGGSH